MSGVRVFMLPPEVLKEMAESGTGYWTDQRGDEAYIVCPDTPEAREDIQELAEGLGADMTGDL